MDVRYVAGLFDGEGWVRVAHDFINRPTKSYHRFQLIAAMSLTYWPTIEALRATFGGTTSRTKNRSPNHRANYQWNIWSGKAYAFLEAIEPHLLEKREQVRLAMSFQDHMDSIRTHFRVHRGEPPDVAEIHAFRYSLIEQLALLKKQSFDIPPEQLGPLRPKMDLSS